MKVRTTEPRAAIALSTGRLMIVVSGGLEDDKRDQIRTCTAERRSGLKARGDTACPGHA